MKNAGKILMIVGLMALLSCTQQPIEQKWLVLAIVNASNGSLSIENLAIQEYTGGNLTQNVSLSFLRPRVVYVERVIEEMEITSYDLSCYRDSTYWGIDDYVNERNVSVFLDVDYDDYQTEKVEQLDVVYMLHYPVFYLQREEQGNIRGDYECRYGIGVHLKIRTSDGLTYTKTCDLTSDIMEKCRLYSCFMEAENQLEACVKEVVR